MKKSKKNGTKLDWINLGIHSFEGMRIRYGVRPGKKQGVPLLIFNGVGQSIEVLQPLIEAMSGLEIIAYDVPGTGLSDTPVFPMRYCRHAEVAASLIAHLGYEKVAVMGISWGGPLAQQFSKQYSKLASKLILAVSPPGNVMVPGKPSVYWRMSHVKRFTDRNYMRSIAGHIYGGSIRQDDSPIDEHMERLRAPNGRGYLYQGLTMLGWTSLGWLRRLKLPTLIIQGEDDPMVPTINAKIMARLIPNSQLEYIDCGHMLILTRVPALSKLVGEFLRA
ncbi:MAG: poly(3-hydroxyalkanoate) depolymerase [Halioglobus sp.]